MVHAFKSAARVLCAAATLAAAALPLAASAQQGKGLEETLATEYRKAFVGKTVAFVPASLSTDVAQAWYAALKRDLEPLGVKVVVRDPNYNSNTGAQAITELIESKPAVIVVHSPDVQTYARLITRGEAAGVHMLQVNMASSARSGAFVGTDYNALGERYAARVIEACKGKSGKVAIVQGPLSAAPSAYALYGIDKVFKDHPEIKVVSSQPADWDASKAKAITQTVLKQHPDLCAVIGMWDGQDTGTAAAIREAGMTGKVFLITSGGGEQKQACDQVKNGSFDVNVSFNAPAQGASLTTMIRWMMISGVKPGQFKGTVYSTLVDITKKNASDPGMCFTF
ncbi:MAG: sugar ABC transporter substrate-binding protein [Comamonadaceae bacterium]|nr:MAG: sugar ABC transporter substrate-binding protein [Comamonadaceae bacterium]